MCIYHRTNLYCISRFNSLWISWEQRGLSDVVQVAIELHDSLETEASTTMCRRTIFEGVNVVLDRGHWYAEVLGTFGQHFWVVNTLSATGDLLAPHEEVIRVGIVGVMWIQHSVKWSGSSWITVKHVEISVVFLFDEAAESLLSLSGKIFEWRLLNSLLVKHLDTILEMELDNWSLALEVLERILLFNDFNFLLVTLLDACEDMDEQVGQHVQHFEVVFLDRHLHIETCELAQVAICV